MMDLLRVVVGFLATNIVFDNNPVTKLGAVPADGLINATKAFSGAGIDGTFQVVGSEVHRWVLAADQELEKSGMHLYWVYQHFDSPELDLIDSSLKHTSVPLDGFECSTQAHGSTFDESVTTERCFPFVFLGSLPAL